MFLYSTAPGLQVAYVYSSHTRTTCISPLQTCTQLCSEVQTSSIGKTPYKTSSVLEVVYLYTHPEAGRSQNGL